MIAIALKMLVGDPVKLFGLIAGIAFSTLLMAQQGGFFIGLISRAASLISDAPTATIWVVDPQTLTAEAPRGLRSTDLYRVRSVAGVAWASPLSKASVTVTTLEQNISAATISGVDDATLKGVPARFVAGSPDDLRQPDAIAIDQLGFTKLWPNEPVLPGKVLEINDKRAVVTAITDAQPSFGAPVLIHTRMSQLQNFAKLSDRNVSYILVGTVAGDDPAVVADAISAATGLKAQTSSGFQRETINYVVANSGIASAFGVVIVLGAIVGVLVSGLTFTLFINDNIRQFAVLKAIGVTGARLSLMILAQVSLVAGIGYSIGLWIATLFFDAVNQPLSDLKGFWLPWQVAALVALAIAAIVLVATAIGLRRVLWLDPAAAFRS